MESCCGMLCTPVPSMHGQAHLQRKTAESRRKALALPMIWSACVCVCVFTSCGHSLVQVAVQERLVRKGAQCSQDLCSLGLSMAIVNYVSFLCVPFEDLDILEQDVEHERVVRC